MYIIGNVNVYRDVYRASRDLEGFLKTVPEWRVIFKLPVIRALTVSGGYSSICLPEDKNCD